MKIRDRVKELRRVPARDLLPNPKNWRTHTTAREDALRGVLAEIGYADALIAREAPEGLALIDGRFYYYSCPKPTLQVMAPMPFEGTISSRDMLTRKREI